MPDPCSWRAWDVGQRILPPPHHGLLPCDPAEGNWEAQPLPALHASEPEPAAPQGCACDSLAGRTCAALISTRPGAIQVLHTNFSSPSLPIWLPSPLLTGSRPGLVLVWPRNHSLGLLEKLDSEVKKANQGSIKEHRADNPQEAAAGSLACGRKGVKDLL